MTDIIGFLIMCMTAVGILAMIVALIACIVMGIFAFKDELEERAKRRGD